MLSYWLVRDTGKIWSTRDNCYALEADQTLAGFADTEQELREILIRLTDRHPITSEDFAIAIQSHVDATAKARGYADGVALAGYSTSTIPSWSAEAQAFIAWRDAVWIYAYTELAKVNGGQRPVPTIAELIAELPTITWPGV